MEQIHCLFTCKSWTNLKIKKKTLFLSKYFIYFEILRIRNVAQFMKIFVTMQNWKSILDRAFRAIKSNHRNATNATIAVKKENKKEETVQKQKPQ